MGFIGNTGGSGGGTPTTIYFSVTYAEAQALVSGSSVVPGATYLISDKNVEVTGIATDAFSLEGSYLRGAEWNFCEYDFTNDHVQLEVDIRGNRIGASYLYILYGFIPADPRSVFRWGDGFCINNTVHNAYFSCSGTTGDILGNTITEASSVTITGNPTLANNYIKSGSSIAGTGFTGALSGNTISEGTTLNVAGSSATIANCQMINGSVVDFTGHTGTIVQVHYSAATSTCSDTCNINNSIVEDSTVIVSGSVDASNTVCKNSSSITASGNGSIKGAQTYNSSDIIVRASAGCQNAILNGGNTLDITGTVDATAVTMYTGATCTATGSVFIEGLVMRNVSVCSFSGSVNCGAGQIGNQSTVNISGSGNYSNCYWEGVNITGSGLVDATNSELNFTQTVLTNGAVINNSYINLAALSSEILAYNNSQPNQYVTTEGSTKTETFTVALNAIDFDAANINHYTGNVVIDSTSTIDTISNITSGTGAPPKRFRITPTTGNTVTFDSTTATNILFPSGVVTVTANGTNGDWVELETDGTNCYIVEINNF